MYELATRSVSDVDNHRGQAMDPVIEYLRASIAEKEAELRVLRQLLDKRIAESESAVTVTDSTTSVDVRQTETVTEKKGVNQLKKENADRLRGQIKEILKDGARLTPAEIHEALSERFGVIHEKQYLRSFLSRRVKYDGMLLRDGNRYFLPGSETGDTSMLTPTSALPSAK